MKRKIRKPLREEAAPSFDTWLRRLRKARKPDLSRQTAQFVEVLKTVGAPMIDGARVHFVYYDPEARQVGVSGEFNQWGRGGNFLQLKPLRGTGIFYGTLDLKEPARLEYKFVVDGQWRTDPLCPNSVENGFGDRNSYFVVGDFRDPPELEAVPGVPHGRVEEFDFRSRLMANSRSVYVYLPAGYEDDDARRFPTFYVHDGGEYLSRARIENVLDNLIHAGVICPLVAVMIDPVNRMSEYQANENYAKFLESELLPYIDEHYRTIREREQRGVMGASLGGLIALYVALSRPSLFSRVGGQSSAFFMAEEKLAALAQNASPGDAFYFDVGKYEPRFIPAHRNLVALLESTGARCLFQELPGGHNWTSWRAHLRDLLAFLWGTSKSNGLSAESSGPQRSGI
jgi:enterochelin esterase-like enzyme